MEPLTKNYTTHKTKILSIDLIPHIFIDTINMIKHFKICLNS